MLGVFFFIKFRPEYDAIIRNMIFYRFVVDRTTFSDPIFVKNVIFSILWYFWNFWYYASQFRQPGGCTGVQKIEKSQKSPESPSNYPGISP